MPAPESQGKFREASSIYLRIVENQEKASGADHAQLGKALSDRADEFEAKVTCCFSVPATLQLGILVGLE